MSIQITSAQFMINRGIEPRLFNLDLHTALISDVKSGLKDFDVSLVSWSLSGNNRNMRKFYKIPDPVVRLTDKSWLSHTTEDFEAVADHYSEYFSTFDGFVCTFPPAFMQIFQKFDKPILIYSGTRYEAPFTQHAEAWRSLNADIKTGIDSGKLLFATNNLADRDYIEYFSGIKPKLLPSLCDYTKMVWTPEPEKNIVFSKSKYLVNEIFRLTNGNWQSAENLLGKNFSYRELAKVSRILVIPYNISTMSLFEYATAGIEVLVPSKEFLRRLFLENDSVLSELSFYQVQGLNVDNLEDHNPNNYLSNNFFDWWVDRSDFYNSELMPNVRLIDSFEELLLEPSLIDANWRSRTKARNRVLKDSKYEFFGNFIDML